MYFSLLTIRQGIQLRMLWWDSFRPVEMLCFLSHLAKQLHFSPISIYFSLKSCFQIAQLHDSLLNLCNTTIYAVQLGCAIRLFVIAQLHTPYSFNFFHVLF